MQEATTCCQYANKVQNNAMHAKSIAEMRISYDLTSLGDREVLSDPIAQFNAWFQDINTTDVLEANAMVITTVSADGIPQARTVLLKSFDADGLVFYTNYDSAKGRAIEANPNVCALFYWPSHQRQVRWTGIATRVSDEQSDEYFASRPRGSQLGAWASNQSQPVESAEVLRHRFDELQHSFGEEEAIPRPENWGGYRIKPVTIEFWQGRENRLHDRILYTHTDTGEWTISRLAP